MEEENWNINKYYSSRNRHDIMSIIIMAAISDIFKIASGSFIWKWPADNWKFFNRVHKMIMGLQINIWKSPK